MVTPRRSILTALLVLQSAFCLSSAFHMHKIMAAALLANSLQRNTYLPLPIPIPIPVKAGGNTIIAVPSHDQEQDITYIPLKSGCHRPPCFGGHQGRRIDFW